MRVPDTALDTYYRLLLGEAPPADAGPRDAKRALARALVARFARRGRGRCGRGSTSTACTSSTLPPEEIEDAAFEPVNRTPSTCPH